MYLLDTNVVSELRKVRVGTGDGRVKRWEDGVSIHDLYVSVVTIEEIEIGVLQIERHDGPQGAALRGWLSNYVLPTFDSRIVPVDVAIARRSARLHVPDPQPIRDAMIAATALVHGMTIVTRNEADFLPLGVTVLNPWQELAI